MTEETMAVDFSAPPEQDFDTVGFQGSMQQILQQNEGNFVSVDFLIGTDTLVTKQGILYSVGSQFMVLYDEETRRYEVCDIFPVKFVTFFLPGEKPGETPPTPADAVQEVARELVHTPAQPAYAPLTPGQAAYAHAARRPYQPSQRRRSSASSITSTPSV